MKKYLCAFLMAVILCVAVLPTFGDTVYAETDGYYTYTVSDGSATITKYSNSNSEKIIVPSTLGGNTVVGIAEYAFNGCTNLTDITIPNSVTNIWDDAFLYCYMLTNINVDSANVNYSSVDGVLFDKAITLLIRCPMFKSGEYTVPSTVASIKKSAFKECGSLKSIKLPSDITNIENYAFYGCTSLQAINLSDCITNIGIYAFDGCSSLQAINLPDGLKSIGEAMFRSCTSLTSIELPNGVTSIGKYAFFNCRSLKTIFIPSSVTTISGVAFIISGDTIEIGGGVYTSSVSGGGSIYQIGLPTIYCTSNSYAYKYAKNYSIPYVLMDNINNFQLSVANPTIDSLNKNINVSVVITNSNMQPANATMCIAIYDTKGKLVKITRHLITLSESITTTINKTIALPHDLQKGYKVKAYIYNNTGSMMPIALASSKTI